MTKYWIWSAVIAISLGTRAGATVSPGHGITIGNQPSISISGGTYRGNEGGTTQTNPSNTVYVAGGDGIHIENIPSVTINDGMMLGGDGGTAPPGVSTISGNGLHIANAPSITINGGMAVGGNEGASNTSGGHGVVLTNATATFYGGEFQGGAPGGAGLLANNANVSLEGGTFSDIMVLNLAELSVHAGVSMGSLIVEGDSTLHQLDASCSKIALKMGVLTAPIPSFHCARSTHLSFQNGRLELSGDLVLTNGLYLDFPNSSKPATNAITVTGTAMISGSLNLNLHPETLKIGKQLCLLSCTSMTGRFENADGVVESNHCTYQIIHESGYVLIEKIAENKTARGTPHWWLTKHGLTNDLFEVEDAADLDRDGLAAWEEYITGTDPSDATSTLSAELDMTGPETLEFTWPSQSNVVYRLLCFTNLMQTAPVVLKKDIFAIPPTNHVSLNRGDVAPAFLQIEAQARILDSMNYELVTADNPTFVGTFCITNATQFETMKDELGLAAQSFDFSTEAVIGIMAPLTSSITGQYRMTAVYETTDTILVCYQFLSYYPNSMPAFNNEVMVVKTEHRGKPTRLVLLGTVYPGTPPVWANPWISIDPSDAPAAVYRVQVENP